MKNITPVFLPGEKGRYKEGVCGGGVGGGFCSFVLFFVFLIPTYLPTLGPDLGGSTYTMEEVGCLVCVYGLVGIPRWISLLVVLGGTR